MLFKVNCQIVHLKKIYSTFFYLDSLYYETWQLIHDNLHNYLKSIEVSSYKHLLIKNYNIINEGNIDVTCEII